MKGLDTNVLVRFLLRDDARQGAAARSLIAAERAADTPAMISLLVILETEWVLRSQAGFDKATVIRALGSLLEVDSLAFENERAIGEALYLYEHSNVEFADCLIVAQYRHLGRTMLTFDSRAARLPGAELLRA